MRGQKRNISLSQLSTAEKAVRKNVLDELSRAIKTARDLNPTSSNTLVIISRYKVLHPWITKDKVDSYMRRIKQSNQITDAVYTPVQTNPVVCSSAGGRPKGSTIAKKLEEDSKKIMAMNEISSAYAELKASTTGRIKPSIYKKMHDEVIT